MLSPASDLDSIEAPQALRAPRTTTVHGRSLTDEYGWLRDKDDPRVRTYLEAENRYAKAAMAPLELPANALLIARKCRL
jgi:oligopeptidase B